MVRTRTLFIATTLCLTVAGVARGQDQDNPPKDLERQLDELRRDTDERIKRLESELEEVRKGEHEDGGDDDLDLDSLIGEAEEEAGEEVPPAQEDFLQKALNTLNPRITVFGDFTGRTGLRKEPLRQDPVDTTSAKLDDRFNLRELEIDLRAAVDPYANAVVIIAFETEDPGQLAGDVVVEEGYVTLQFLPFGLTPKIGRFHVGFGQINTLHRHDLPQPNYPLPVAEFLGEEGLVEQGVSLQWLIPNPFGLSLTWTTQVLNGEEAPILAGGNSEHLSYVSRLSYFQEIGESFSVEIGTSILFGYNDRDAKQKTVLSGADLFLRWRPRKESQRWSVVAQGELYYLDLEQGLGVESHAYGAYGYLQVQAWQSWYAGVRYEYTKLPLDDKSKAWRAGAYLSYYFSEFLRVRVGWEHTERDFSTAAGVRVPTNDGLVLQITFVFGSHPVEPYWQNK